MQKILIIKLGALGDVVRTTPLLRVLKGEITWITQSNALPLLKNNPCLHTLWDVQHLPAFLDKNYYDLVINLDEDPRACRLATGLKKRELIGPYCSSNGINYTDSSAAWFDMSLISRLGKKAANREKWENRRSYQEILFSFLNKKFKAEEYILPCKTGKSEHLKKIIGLEARAGERWVAKQWPRFPEFIRNLDRHKVPYRQFHQSPTLRQFIDQIDRTDFVVTTDSLTLHLALGLKKKIVALFTCTSPHEIYDYSRTVKIVSPLLKKHFYSTEKSLESGQAIPPEKVFESLRQLHFDS